MHANGVHYTNDGHLLVSGKVDKNSVDKPDKTREDVGGGRDEDEADQVERR